MKQETLLDEQDVRKREKHAEDASLSWWQKLGVVVSLPIIVVIGVVSGFVFALYSIKSWITGKKPVQDSIESLDDALKDVPEQKVSHAKTVGKKELPAVTKVTVDKIARQSFDFIEMARNIYAFDKTDSYYVEKSKSVITKAAYNKVQAVHAVLQRYVKEVVGSLSDPISLDGVLKDTNQFLLSISDESIKHGAAGVISGFLRRVAGAQGDNVYDVVVSLNERDGYFKFAHKLFTNPVALLPETKLADLPALLFETVPNGIRHFAVIKDGGNVEGLNRYNGNGVPLMFGHLFPRASVEELQDGSVITLGRLGKCGAGIIDFTSDISPFHDTTDAQEVSILGGKYSLSHSNSNSGVIEGGGCNGAYVAITDGLAKLALRDGDVVKATAMTDFYNTLFHGRQVKNSVVADVLADYIKMKDPSDKDVRQSFVKALQKRESILSKDGRYILHQLNSERFYDEGYKAVCSDIMIPMIVARARGKIGSDVKQWSAVEHQFIEQDAAIQQAVVHHVR